MNIVETYIREVLDIYSSGEAVKETSYYPPLSNLFNAIGKTLKPEVRCIINIKNRGSGIPDAGLFTRDQLRKFAGNEPFIKQLPARGVIEAKGMNEKTLDVANTGQVSKYLDRYGQVLVTNFIDFRLVKRNAYGQLIHLETYRLAEDETTFLAIATNPKKVADEIGEYFVEFLKRVILYATPLVTPEDVAMLLASYARDARLRIIRSDLLALQAIRSDLEKTLGIKFEGKKGEHFFRSTLVQTIFYGVFSAWVLWCKQYESSDVQMNFSWKEAVWYLQVPIIKALFEEVVTPTKLGSLGIIDVLDWTGAALNRVDKTAFFTKFEEDHAVQYFYEPFLQAFDPELRKDLGVWYTPIEIVRYMVERVDKVLREELKIEDGLADPSVYVLDPSCGTGAFLTEVLKRIAKTLHEKGEDALGLYDVKLSALERVFGFEILPAPFVIAHLQMGLLLQNFGVPLSVDKQERVGVYLTNSLVGWETPDSAKNQLTQLSIPALKAEQDAADRIKRDVPILVILGNPPYNAFAGVGSEEEESLVAPYKEGLFSEWGIKKYNLGELYVRFFGLAEQRIEKTGKGLICYISNFSYLDDNSFVVMRKRFLGQFDQFWFDCMNGASRGTGKLTPEGKPDPSVFSTEYNREGIRLGTTIGLMVRKSRRDEDNEKKVRFRQFWGVTKRSDLFRSLNDEDFEASYQFIDPSRSNLFSFKPFNVPSYYLSWPKLTELSLNPPGNGLMEKRSGSLIDIDKDALELRMKMYYDHKVEWENLKALNTGLTRDAARFDARKSRTKVKNAENYNPDHLLRYVFRPFDTRWCYYSTVRPLWNEPRPALWSQCWDGNSFLLSRMAASKDIEGPPFYFVKGLSDDHTLIPDASCFPIRVVQSKTKNPAQEVLIAEAIEADNIPKANLSLKARDYLKSLNIDDPDSDVSIADLIWMHVLAIGYSPMYLFENIHGIQQSWPRIPLPNDENTLTISANLGRSIALLLDLSRTSISGITSGKLRTELQSLAIISRVGSGVLNPDVGDLTVRANWGHMNADGAIMPGKGKIVKRSYTEMELAMIKQGSKSLGLTEEQVIECFGENTCDIYLNNVAYWRNIPVNVWNYTIGGYQVIKKWLSYREYELLHRDLSRQEVREITNITRRIAAIVLLGPFLDKNYITLKHSTYIWPVSN